MDILSQVTIVRKIKWESTIVKSERITGRLRGRSEK